MAPILRLLMELLALLISERTITLEDFSLVSLQQRIKSLSAGQAIGNTAKSFLQANWKVGDQVCLSHDAFISQT
jgi:hypothetical protein